MPYTVKALAALSGVTERALRYYDAIGLLPPAWTGANGYRYYDDGSAQRLQQILFFRELGLPLREIGALLDRPDFDPLAALQAHRAALIQRAQQLDALIHTLDRTILKLQGAIEMSDQELFQGFSPEKQAEYEAEMRARYPDTVDESVRRWNSYSPAEQARLGAEFTATFAALRDAVGEGPDSPAVQALIAVLHRQIGYFWDCSVECFMGLGEMYHTHPDFIATFQRLHPALPDFLYDAISIYCIEQA